MPRNHGRSRIRFELTVSLRILHGPLVGTPSADCPFGRGSPPSDTRCGRRSDLERTRACPVPARAIDAQSFDRAIGHSKRGTAQSVFPTHSSGVCSIETVCIQGGRDMTATVSTDVLETVRRAAWPIDERSLDPLLERIEDARFVLIGEASHGTEEFYRLRAELTKRLIEERGFHAVAAEADWPDAFRVNRYVRARSDDPHPDAALSDFRRFPQWMWRNTVVLDFVGWLRSHNDAQPREEAKAGVYGLDLYSLNSSIESVLEYLEKVDPEAARRARARYSCFDHFGDDAQAYGYATSLGV